MLNKKFFFLFALFIANPCKGFLPLNPFKKCLRPWSKINPERDAAPGGRLSRFWYDDYKKRFYSKFISNSQDLKPLYFSYENQKNKYNSYDIFVKVEDVKSAKKCFVELADDKKKKYRSIPGLPHNAFPIAKTSSATAFLCIEDVDIDKPELKNQDNEINIEDYLYVYLDIHKYLATPEVKDLSDERCVNDETRPYFERWIMGAAKLSGKEQIRLNAVYFLEGFVPASYIEQSLYNLPYNTFTRPAALASLYALAAYIAKKTIYNWFFRRPVNALLESQITAAKVLKRTLGMWKSPKVENFTFDKAEEEFVNKLVERIKKKNKILGKGIIFHGVPGNGKTVLAKLIAKKSNAIYLEINPLKLLAPIDGKSKIESLDKIIKNLFYTSTILGKFLKRPVIIFWDELDAFFIDRTSSKQTQETAALTNALLTSLQELDSNSGVYFFGATNYLDTLDKGLTREGRAGCLFEIKNPSTEGILAIFDFYKLKNPKAFLEISQDAWVHVANLFSGYSRAKIMGVLEELDIEMTDATSEHNKDEVFKELINKIISQDKTL